MNRTQLLSVAKKLRTNAERQVDAAEALEAVAGKRPVIRMKRSLSIAARKRIARAQRKRWKLIHGGKKAA